jgi:dipeptidase E
MRAFFGRIEQLLFIPYALADHDGYLEVIRTRGQDAGYHLIGIHRARDPVRAVLEASAIYVGGGNTFRLLAELYARNLLDPIRQRVRAGVPYLGISAGCNVACPTIRTSNDMPITSPPSLDALGLVGFQVNPHYFVGQTHVKRDDGYHEHFGETRDDRLREFHEMNSTPVVGLWEAGTLLVEPGKVLLAGARARLFRKGLAPIDVEPETDLSPLLTPGSTRVAYTVAASFTDVNLADRWLAWLSGGHLARVIAGGAIDAEVIELDSAEGLAFEVRYHFPSREAFARYEAEFAPALREEGTRLFPPEKGVVYRRSLGVERTT